MSNFELSNLALKSAFSDNTIITDDKGLPSVMVFVPKFKMSDVIAGGSDSVHPAFIVDGVEKDGIYISKYQNVVYDGRAYSLPAETPKTSISFDDAVLSCTAKGAGWHMMTAMEWGAIALWCKHNGWLPYGNNDFGKDKNESEYKAIPTVYDDSGRITIVATGSGPVEWSHNKQLDGIYDLNGNCAELLGGLRVVRGELQILENNNAANSDNSQSANSAQWKAIDGTTGELITPDGSGTTQNSLKLDFEDSKWHWVTEAITNKGSYTNLYSALSASETVCAKAIELLYALALLPYDGDSYGGGQCYLDTTLSEALFSSGGAAGSAGSGVFRRAISSTRKGTGHNLGFRSAYYE